MRCSLLLPVVLASLVGCGDSVVVRPGTGGTSPAPTVTGTGTTSTTSTPTGAPTHQPCGVGHPPCPPYEYCEMEGEQCDVQGVCDARPIGCDDDCPGVCGCNGETYCNECMAKADGTDISAGECSDDDVEYAAAAWPGGMDHIIIMKANYSSNTCWRIYLDAPSTGVYSIDVPAPWGLSALTPTNEVTNCLDWQAPQEGQGAVPFIGTGAITWEFENGALYPCELSIDAHAAFEEPPPPSLQSESFLAHNIPVEGGCF